MLRPKRALNLRKETVRQLTREEVAAVDGGTFDSNGGTCWQWTCKRGCSLNVCQTINETDGCQSLAPPSCVTQPCM